MLQPYMQELVGDGVCFRDLTRFIKSAATTTSSIFILGEPGTGKEVTARAIHFGSRRKNHPFVSIDASLYYEKELERELFGVSASGGVPARKGLLEFATRGTCYIAHAEELPASVQVRLARAATTGALERVGSTRKRSTRARIVLASCKDIGGFTEGGLFSKELFAAVSENIIEIPPLRTRPEDVVPFVTHVAQSFTVEQLSSPDAVTFAEDAIDALREYPWPGNYDELKAELLRIFKLGIYRVSRDVLSPEIVQHSYGRQGVPAIRRVIEELESAMQEFSIMVRLDSEYGDILIDDRDWDLKLKCFDRCFE